ncbi:hypothetical protein BVY01_02455 [bacterium I07]|nr:hypothetical protein BVY01_02455 [bacterium I07]
MIIDTPARLSFESFEDFLSVLALTFFKIVLCLLLIYKANYLYSQTNESSIDTAIVIIENTENEEIVKKSTEDESSTFSISKKTDFNAEVMDVWLEHFPPTSSQDPDIYCRVRNLSDYNNGYNGAGTFDIRIGVYRPDGYIINYYWNNYEMTYNQTIKFAKRSCPYFNAEGAYKIVGEVYDINGYENNWDSSHRFSEDHISVYRQNEPPTISIIGGPLDGETIRTYEVTFSWQGSDIDGRIVEYQYRFDGNWHTVSGTSQTFFDLTEGSTHTFQVRSVDNSGMISSWTPLRTFYVDLNNNPTISITGGPSNGERVTTSSVTFSWQGTDTDGWIVEYVYFFDRNDAVITTSTSKTFADLEDGSSHQFEVFCIDNERASSSYTPLRTFYVDLDNKTIYNITIQTEPDGLDFLVDGITYNSPQTFKWESGNQHNISTNSVQNGFTGTRYVYTSWSDGGAMSHTYTTPSSNQTVIVNFKTQYYLTLVSDYGTLSGQGWGDSGSRRQFTVYPSTITEGSGTRNLFSRWGGSGSGSYSGSSISAGATMNGPIVETAEWQTQYHLTTSVNPQNSGTVSISPSGEWHNEGESVTLTATESNGYTFVKWSGGVSSSANPVNIIMDGEKSIEAEFVKQKPPNISITIEPPGYSVEDLPGNRLSEDRLNLSVKVCNESQTIDYENVTVKSYLDNKPLEFYREDPNFIGEIDVLNRTSCFGFLIYSEPIQSDFDNAELIVSIVSVNGKELNAENSISLRETLSFYYAQHSSENRRMFDTSLDGYNFPNPSGFSWEEFISYFSFNTFDLLRGLPIAVFSQWSNWKGRCFGMAITSGYYFINPNLRPYSGNLHDWSKSDAMPGISRSHLSQIKYAYKEFDNNESYQNIKQNLKRGNPLVLAIKEKDGGSGHAILVTKLLEMKESKLGYFDSYDSNYPESIVTGVYNLNDYSFNMIYHYPSYNITRTHELNNWNYGDLMSDNFLNQIASDIADKAMFWITCPAIMYVENNRGQKFGYIEENEFVNEISNARIMRAAASSNTGDSVTVIYVPNSDSYSVIINALDNGTLDFGQSWITESGEFVSATLDDVAIDRQTVCYFEYSDGEYFMRLDDDGDGNIDTVLPALFTQMRTTGLLDSPSPMFQINPQHTGQSSLIGPDRPILNWTFRTRGKLTSSPVISNDGRIFIGSEDSTLYVFEREGLLCNSYKTNAIITSTVALNVFNSVYLSGDQLYGFSYDNSVYWTQDLGANSLSSPSIDKTGNLIITSIEGGIYKFSSDGELIWQYNMHDTVFASPALNDSGDVYVGSNQGTLIALDSEGELLWQFTVGAAIKSSPTICSEGTIIFGTDDNSIYAINPDGSLKWAISTGDRVVSTPAIGNNDVIYVGSTDGHLYALNMDGIILWKYLTNAPIYASSIIDLQGTIYIGSTDSSLYAINPDGSLKWDYRLGGAIFSSVAIGDSNIIYVGSDDGVLYAIRNDTTSTTSVDLTIANSPAGFILGHNYPNPFNPNTVIPYQIPELNHVVIEIFNLVGQKIRTLVDEQKQAGLYSILWDGRNDSGQLVSNGIYIYRMSSGKYTRIMKCVFMK